MKAPLPPPPQPSSDDEDAHDNTSAAEAQLTMAWQDALSWAKRGDRRSLVEMLRGNHVLDDREVRNFLADLLENKEKRPRGKPAIRPKYTFAINASGDIAWVDERDSERLKIKKWMHDNKTAHCNHAALLEAAAKHFKMDSDRLENIVRRSANAWKRSRST
jgi:hypothetical protein